MRACRLIEHLWYLYEHEKQQQKKREFKVEWKEVVFFHFIHADELLIQAVRRNNNNNKRERKLNDDDDARQMIHTDWFEWKQ